MLIGNGALVHRQLCRQIGGGLAGDIYAWGRTERMNRFTGGVDNRSGAMPGGHLAPSAWVLPKTAGGMSAFIGTNITVGTGDLAVTAGRNIDGSTSISFAVPDAQLNLIVSADGTVSITVSSSGTLAGALSASGTSAWSVSVGTTTLGAIVDAIASCAIAFTTDATIRADGYMTGSTETTGTELTAAAIASAVWAQVMDGTLTADDVMRVTLAVLAGESTVTNTTNGVEVVFKSPDGTTRVTSEVIAGERASVSLTP